MYSFKMYTTNCVIFVIFSLGSCNSEMLSTSSLHLYSPGELDFADVIVKHVGDTLTLTCELRGETGALYVWNYVPANSSLGGRQEYTVEHNGTAGSHLHKHGLTVADSGRYMCSAPPYSASKFILVQPYHSASCALSAFVCGARCVLPAYVCDGRADCVHGEDEAELLCGPAPCARSDRLNCSSGRCISVELCCRPPSTPLCRQHACCHDHPRLAIQSDFMDGEISPSLYEDRHAPDDYGFIQSTIYTVTACALIFMIAVVLLVSAICKMHMKRAALRSYAHADRQTRAHYDLHYAQCMSEVRAPSPSCPGSPGSPSGPGGDRRGTRLTALTSVFTSRYRQVPTQCTDVEMTSVNSTTLSSPQRGVRNYRSPVESGEDACCDGAPCLNSPADEHPDRQRLTLQLGRFQLSIPRFGRSDPRPDTPNVAEINIDDLDFVRLNSNDTYTLNGRTIRLLGGNFENYPVLNNPPPYNEAMRYKLYGPPPEYLSRDRLNRVNVDEEARSNVEMPPGYEELNGNSAGNIGQNLAGNIGQNLVGNIGQNTESNNRHNNADNNGHDTVNNEQNGSNTGYNMSRHNNVGNSGNDTVNNEQNGSNIGCSTPNNGQVNRTDENGACSTINEETEIFLTCNANNNLTSNVTATGNVVTNNVTTGNVTEGNGNVETLNSVIDNLPAIDSDFNANDTVNGNVLVT